MTKQNVVVYVSNGCGECKKVINHLEDWGVPFIEKNINENKEYFRELQKNKVYGTPAVFKDDDIVLGFQERRLKQTLGIVGH
ncbi:glutaredoxin family protein [Radiobacillus kanasensis]|uniref:glutaredoxin family protein n=1 Tax=Radiobacillus kanasensis TaxID=2844358 RepID=UPI001E2AE1D2|nr:glutaredoxin family protein [Radiobacillus kanasensis]UFT99810.1 glutaredoxin family protein [Radiobacillus kanasensis]